MSGSDNNDIIGNIITNNDYGGIYSYYGDNNEFNDSKIYENNGYGLYSEGSNFNTVSNNFIINNDNSGLLLESSDNFEIIGNYLCFNEYGAYLNKYSNDNTFYLNNFTGNFNVNAYQATVTNDWNSVTFGNYWDNYTGKDANDDNIGDSAFNFTTGTDNYPIFWDSPDISLNAPILGESFETAPSFEIVLVEGVNHTSWYTLDNGTTITISPGLTSTINETKWSSAADGPIQLIFYVNDSKGYVDQVSVDITKITDIPQIIIILPTLNQVFGTQPPTFTISITDTSSIVSRWYTIDGGTNNNTFTGLTGTTTSSTWDTAPEGEIIVTFFAEDEIGNIGFSSRSIIKDLSVIIDDIDDNPPQQIPGYNLLSLLGVTLAISIIFAKLKCKN